MKTKLRVTVLTLFPEMFPGPLGYSLAGKALTDRVWLLDTLNIRDFSHLKHQKVDDKPYGGGNGLIMRADIVDKALEKAASMHKHPTIIHFSPKGQIFNQTLVNEYLTRNKPHSPQEIILLCGRYEGIDQRVIDIWKKKGMDEICIGDYILSGGEVAALVFLDALIRKVILKNEDTLNSESFEQGMLEYPQFTSPQTYKKLSVPDVLLSGHHEKINTWRKNQSTSLTKKLRPELLKKK